MIIIYGGTFNPPTIAHDQIIKLINKKMNPDKIIIVPSSDGYYKDGLINFNNRVDMLKIMCSNYLFNYEISLVEAGTTFNGTISLLNYFQEKYEKDIYFVVGSDHLSIFNTWIDYEKLLTNYKFIIINRIGHPIDLTYLEKYNTTYEIIDFNVDISSSQIREDLENHIKYLPEGVYQYIKKHQLYNQKKERSLIHVL